MGRHVLEGNPPITVALKRTARARRLSLRVSRLDGQVTLTLPTQLPENEALAFLYDRESWLRRHVGRVPDRHEVAVHETVPFRGGTMPVARAAVRRAVMQDNRLLVPQAGPIGPRVQAFLKVQARDALCAASDAYAQAAGKSYKRLSLRDTRSRWGSCSSRGTLMYSWRLIMAPPEILRYVAAHEVAHLVEMNHSPAFWAVVEDLYGPCSAARHWLRREGSALHRVSFGE